MPRNNFNPEQWNAHLKAQRDAEERVTPILRKQTKNDPKVKSKKKS